MKATPAEIQKYLDVISKTPGQIMQATKGWEEAQLQFKADSKS